ncbi:MULTISPECIES: hypothetical protein [Clostridium]|uniref:Uncharacterized protein n=2 Tax=Clostridium TaxID=1485 RepID=D8GIZ7_CLOLD|nr:MULTISPECIES: hypothetical protein [Clostridium]ADK15072.1 hypothetical protein CLJU_c20100 [Clostridium ljungdahlii DSM 13528]AGY74326.1 hypothetical protein CAETHG_0091 [Clostridium autoethanogenum DSM 10061]ALU34517.1 Hypothetical protein CLAU_0088 [Clostridium autoethanogenum DSM 10061]OAA87734.1 hypothetical protein WX45_03296 [Clostridium ljungdahlii DSM 13528]OVY51237.1 hypothetical protein WX72_02399 [Clostridium autoethanogenum]
MKSMKKILVLFMILVIFTFFNECGVKSNSEKQPTSTSKSQSTTRTIIDMDGNTINIPEKVSKAGCTIGAINQMVLMLGDPYWNVLKK